MSGSREVPSPQAGSADQAPQRFGKYEVRVLLGFGSDLYGATDVESGRPVALKVLRVPPSASSRRRMRVLREAQALARISHPNVARVLDVGGGADHVFVAIELVHGFSLDRWLHMKTRRWREILALFLQAGEGLSAAHGQGLTHRDFRTNNVMVTKEGRAMLADFGLSRILRGESPLTDPLAPATGVAYLSPEQLKGRSPDPRSDQFSFCVALYEALFGAHPFQPSEAAGDQPAEIALALAIVQGRLRPATHSAAPEAIRSILLRGLSLEPQARFRSMRPLLDALRAEGERAKRGPTKLVFAGIAASILALSTGTVLGAVSGADDSSRVGPAYVAPLRLARERAEAGIAAAYAKNTDDARRAFEDAIGIYEKIPGAEAELAQTLINYGRLLAGRANPEAALQNLERAGALIEQKLGADRAELAQVLSEQGIVAMSARNLDQAIEFHRRALAIREKVLEPSHPKLVDSVRALGWLYREAGRWNEAIEAYSRALSIRRQRYGANSGDAARSHADLGWVLLAQGAFDEAEQHFDQAEAIAKQLGATQTPEVATLVRGRALVDLAQNKPQDAIARLEPALRVQEARGNRLEVARTRFALSVALTNAEKDPARARALAADARAAFENAGLGTSPQALVIQMWQERSDP